MANKWDAVEALPDGLDVAQAVVYREVDGVDLPLGGRWLVWPDQVWWQRPDGRWQPSVLKAELDGPRWERVEA